MIAKNITIELHDDKFTSLLSRRGCFPIDFLWNSIEEYIDWQTGLPPCQGGEHYRVVDLLKTLENMKRCNFIELIFGIDKQELDETQGKLW